MEIRKIIYNGTSCLVALPPKFLAASKLTQGDYVRLELMRDFTIKVSKLPVSSLPYVQGATKGNSE